MIRSTFRDIRKKLRLQRLQVIDYLSVTDRTSDFHYDTYSDYISTTRLLICNVLNPVDRHRTVCARRSSALFGFTDSFRCIDEYVCLHVRPVTIY